MAEEFVRLIRQPGEVIELRALMVATRYGKPKTVSGYYRMPEDADLLAEAAVDLSETAAGVYVTLNPVLPALMARAYRRTQDNPEHTTADKDIVKRSWVLVDIDPVRPGGISASDSERAAAVAVGDQVRGFLEAKGFPAPVVADSGNGLHLIYPIDLPRDDGGDVERLLKSLSERCSTAAAEVDTSCHNPARITKLPGTFARKGDNCPDIGRPHRVARVLEVPV